jgi:mono/diheme cytochrome c family protein
MRVFLPLAAAFTLASGFGLYRFLTIEVTAAAEIPPAETAPIFLPQTPTPTAAPLPTPTAGQLTLTTWEAGIGALLSQRCGACHGPAAMSGLSISTYASTLQGGNGGAGVVPGNADDSWLVRIQTAGGHPGQLSESELSAIIGWISAGAPER